MHAACDGGAVRVLRLTNSNDVQASIPEALRASVIAERTAAELIGEPVETELRVFWPGPTLPGILEKWLDRYNPDMVFMRASSFWVCYASVPVKLQRRYGALGTWSGRAGFKVGGNAGIAGNPIARKLREFAGRTIGGEPHFAPEEATEYVAAMLRVILAREVAIPVLRGPAHTHNARGDAAGYTLAERLTDDFDARLAALCAKLHVPYTASRNAASPALLAADGIHDTIEGQRVFGELEGRAMAEAWLAAKGH
jgi:hypothetical protein